MESMVDKTLKWTLDDPDLNYYDIYDLIEFREKHYDEYHPTVGPYLPFRYRLQNWLDSANLEEDQKLLLRTVPEILFINSDEFISLYRTAFNETVIQWLIDLENLNIADPDLEKQLESAVAKTWFCPITDSMHIADFLHVNNIAGQDYRPDWRSLTKLACGEKIANYIAETGITYLVLLEDFVGSGIQMEETLRFACTVDNHFPILIVPLIICPKGVTVGENIETDYSNMKFRPVLRLPADMLIQRSAQIGEPAIYGNIRELCLRLETQIQSGQPFGFMDTGALFVMYTNCPDNTFPFIHRRSGVWNPLFPRSSRE